MKAKRDRVFYLFKKEVFNNSIAKRAVLFGIVFGVLALGTMAIMKSRKSKGGMLPTATIPINSGTNQFPFVNPTAATEQVSEVPPFKSIIKILCNV